MSSPNSRSTHLSPTERELHEFIAGELVSAGGGPPIGPDDDLIKRGIVDSLGVMQLVEFCESRYGIAVTDEDLVPANFQTVRRLAAYVEGKQVNSPSRSG
jgi:acyl carrier protein